MRVGSMVFSPNANETLVRGEIETIGARGLKADRVKYNLSIGLGRHLEMQEFNCHHLAI